MKDIVALTGLAYGVIDDNYRLIRNEMAENTLIYDENRLARGIDLWLDGTDILLSLSLPTTRSEIRLFYHVITTICNEVSTKKYIREEDTVSLKDNERFMQYDEDASIGALKDLQEKIGNDEYRRFEIFGVFNPISISLKEIQKIGNNLEQLEKYLHEIQALDVYYATSNVYRTPEEKLIGIYAIVADVPRVVPTEPYVIMNQIAGVEASQFAGMDTSEMQVRLVDLSQRYDEAARDDRSDAAEQQRNLSALRAKIARRQAEQYQSKFTQALADISAKVKELGARYQRETAAYKAFHAGMECPTCHRPVTEQSLSEVQAALKKVISDLYAAGTEQRGQLTELQEMDKKAADTFEQFKADDLAKWQAEAAELEQACTELSGSASKEVERLRIEIQPQSGELVYGTLTQPE